MRRHYHSRQHYDLSWIEIITLFIAIAAGPIGIGIWLLFKYLTDKFGDVIMLVTIIWMIAIKSIIDL